MSTLKVKSLEIKFNDKNILSGIDFQAEEGLNVILAPQKSGKTVLMRSLATLLKVKSGEINFNDLNYKDNSKDIRKKLGYIPEDINIYPQLTAKQFFEIIFDIKIKDKKDKKHNVNEIMKIINLDDKNNNYINNYNQLTKCKLAIGQSIIGDSKLVLMDSILKGLDINEKKEIMDIIKDISSERIVILTTDDFKIVENYYDNIIILDEGSIKFKADRISIEKEGIGTVESIYAKYINKKEEREC